MGEFSQWAECEWVVPPSNRFNSKQQSGSFPCPSEIPSSLSLSPTTCLCLRYCNTFFLVEQKWSKIKNEGVSVVAQQKRIWLVSMRMRVWFLASLSGLRIWHCHELFCRSQTQLRSGVAVAMVYTGSCSSVLTPSLGTSTCHRCSPKKAKKEKKEKRKK